MAGTIVIDTIKSSLSTPTVFQNTSGTEVGQLCRAWVNFNGVTTTSIRASFNVSSVTRNATGDYTVNFTNALSDGNYSVNATSSADTSRSFIHIASTTALTTTGVRMVNEDVAGGNRDQTINCVAIFR
jgi:hypothetical protein